MSFEKRKSTRGAARSANPTRKPGVAERPAAPARKIESERTKRKRRRDGFDRRERAASGEKHPRAKKGPWSGNAYVPSPKVTPMDSKARQGKKPNLQVKPVEAAAPEAAKAPKKRKEERLQKILARSGVASRRAAELLILEGAVTVNGRPITELGTKVDATHDKIKVNGNLIYTEVEPIFIALYKPRGMISALSDPEGRRHLGHIVHSIRERVIPIGRLDYNSEGLMLLTNDGNIADGILKARDLPKVYMVKIKGHPNTEDLAFLKRGFFTAEGVVRFASFGVEQTLKNKSWLKLEVTEGSKLDLRELLNQKGLLVDRIVRTAIGGVSIQGLEPGEYRFLKRLDFEKLLSFSN
ncbi:MAG: rRNA pseudouridine synthase [Deltaproteobacteria bacterium]|nr:rRNA pseudouridine synthase [Deltaproteobacteria bacterium]